MELSRQEYPALLASLQPSQATNVLSDRIRIINKINSDIADWLQERRRVEEAYAQGLRKLAHRPQQDSGAALGIFQLPWQRIVNATEAVAASHEIFAQKIGDDVERPLREYSSKSKELASMPSIQNDLAALAKNYEASQKKVEKAKDKGPRGADKLASAISASEEVREQWDSRAPFVFEQLQAADESRINHLRDVLTQFQTHESDQIERSRQATESCLNVLLNIETADEIKTYATKVNRGRPVVARRAETAPPSATPLPPPPRVQDDSASQRSERSVPARSPQPPEPRPRPLGGLKRLGTVMGRRKSVVQTSSEGPYSSDKKHRSPFASFKRQDSRDMQIPESPQEGPDRPDTALTTQDSHSETARGPSRSSDREGLGVVSNSAEPHPAPITTNGAASQEMHGDSGFSYARSANEPRVDSEGFSERPQTIDEITQAQREAASLDEYGMNLTIRDKPILEDENQAKQAMDEMANQLRLQAQQSGIRRNASAIRGRRDVRNTVFIPNPPTLGNELPTLPSATDVSTPTSPALLTRHVTSLSNATDDHTHSDATSIRSSHTLHSISGPVVHPDLQQPGLNASIIETVNAWFSEGAVTKSFVVGELALVYNAPFGTLSDRTRIRLNNFQVLEKVAANPHFVNEEKDQADENRGEYNVLLSSISRSSPTVAFKYQIHINPSDTSTYCPVIFKPVWNLEELQASVIIFYSFNPSFASSIQRESVTIKNLVLTVNLDTSPEEGREVAHATSAVMYPHTGATFRRKQSAVVWKIPEFELKAGTDGKFLVRFATASSGPRKGKVEAKFELQTADAGSDLGISMVSPPEDTAQKGIDPFADDHAGPQASDEQPFAVWKEVPTVRKLIAGKYVSS